MKFTKLLQTNKHKTKHGAWLHVMCQRYFFGARQFLFLKNVDNKNYT